MPLGANETSFTSETGRAAALKSAEVRRKKKSMRETARMILSLPLNPGQLDTEFEAYNTLANTGVSNPDVQTFILAGIAKKAADGNAECFKQLREVAGLDDNNANGGRDIELSPCIIEKFYKGAHYEIITKRHLDIWLPGGRGGTKSAFAAFEIVKGIEADPTACAVCFRKVGNTLRDSVYAQIQFAIRMLDLNDDYDYSVSPMQIKKRETGQVILFRGCDKAEKSKGITLPDPDMRIRYVWLEELDQFDGMEEVRTLRQSVVRGADDVTVICTYNPPRSRDAWVNSEVIKDDGKYVQESTYLDVPVEWLGQAFINEAETLKAWNEEAYKHEYLGEPVGYGSQVFENLELRPITQEEIDECNAFYNGVDWGYYPDPWVFIRCGVQKAQRKIFIFGELTSNRQSNEQTAEAIKKYLDSLNTDPTKPKAIEPENELITCDSAEPKSIEEYRRLGLKAQKCTKYAGSVETGLKALASGWKIIIDPNRCPLASKEFNGYEFMRLKSGEVVSQYPDENNHTIDATRYALERVLAGRD